MNKTIYLCGPMKPVINVTTRNEGDKNQIIKNINYDQSSLSIFLKQLINKLKWHQIKPILNRDKPVPHQKKTMGLLLRAI